MATLQHEIIPQLKVNSVYGTNGVNTMGFTELHTGNILMKGHYPVNKYLSPSKQNKLTINKVTLVIPSSQNSSLPVEHIIHLRNFFTIQKALVSRSPSITNIGTGGYFQSKKKGGTTLTREQTSKDFGYPVLVKVGDNQLVKGVIPTTDEYIDGKPTFAHIITTLATASLCNIPVKVYLDTGRFFNYYPASIRAYQCAEQRDQEAQLNPKLL